MTPGTEVLIECLLKHVLEAVAEVNEETWRRFDPEDALLGLSEGDYVYAYRSESGLIERMLVAMVDDNGVGWCAEKSTDVDVTGYVRHRRGDPKLVPIGKVNYGKTEIEAAERDREWIESDLAELRKRNEHASRLEQLLSGID